MYNETWGLVNTTVKWKNMDISNAFKTEVFRPIVITLIPGAFSLAPYICFLCLKYPYVADVIKENLAGSTIVYVFASIAAGMVFENIGSRIETWFGLIVAKNDENYNDDWMAYLRTNFEKPPIGLAYISSIVMRMKFELSFSISLTIVVIGISILNTLRSNYWTTEFLVTTGAIFAIGIYLMIEAYSSVKLLGDLRRNLLGGVNAI
jgi:hypothetical protein